MFMKDKYGCKNGCSSSAAPIIVATSVSILGVPIEKRKTGKRTSKKPKRLPYFYIPLPKEPFIMKFDERIIN